jgi:hypothetical protein
MEETRQAQIYGVRPARTFEEAAPKFVLEHQHKRSIGDDVRRLKGLMLLVTLPSFRVTQGANCDRDSRRASAPPCWYERTRNPSTPPAATAQHRLLRGDCARHSDSRHPGPAALPPLARSARIRGNLRVMADAELPFHTQKPSRQAWSPA